jgi:3-hydroxybutyryl-CoA dehydratase
MTGNQDSGAWFDDVRVGDRFARTLTVTETHLVLGAGLIGDFNPHHVDEEYARGSRFGTRILHGMLTSAIMGAPVGMHFHGTALAYLEHNTRFTAPVRAGDTLTTRWTVTELIRKPRQSGGIVVLSGVATNQDGVVVAEALGKILVSDRPAGQPAGTPA